MKISKFAMVCITRYMIESRANLWVEVVII